ncbi:MAG: hypothetical protein ABL973_04855 [Micropepsaceae bacterium]
MTERPSRFWQFMLMLPFFILGVALPVYFYGFSGDGPPNLKGQSYSPIAPAPAPVSSPSYSDYRVTPPSSAAPADRYAVVEFFRGIFDSFVDKYVSASLSPLAIKLVVFFIFFVGVFLLLRLVLILMGGVLGGFLMFLVHKAAAPMFMGFLAVGSTWGIHQTIAQQFGLNWAAATVSLTAAIASLFSLAGVKVR